MIKTKKIDISEWQEEFPGKEPVVVLKKLTFGEYINLQDEIADIKIIGKQQIVNTKIGRAKHLMVLKSIKEAPFEISEKGINNLPFDLGEFIFTEIDNFNEVSPKK